ncbi:MAG TPA: helix-turn-helix transcriptional regulator, partial [Acidimicrobiia bacterium]|nr:helix-turn-helix transcriptional regulator [Acidimicrobiia bacterium]
VAAGAYDDQLEHARAARALLAHVRVPPLGFLIPQTWYPTALYNLDDFAAARDAGHAAHREAERVGDLGLVAHTLALFAGLDWAAGAWDDAVARVETGLALAEETGVDVHVLLGRAILATVAFGRGEHDLAEHQVQLGERFYGEGAKHPFGLDMLLWARAQLLARGGAVDEACAVLGMVWHQTEALRGLVQWRVIGLELVRLRRRCGDDQGAAAVADDVELLAHRSSSRSAQAAALQVRGLTGDDPAPLVAAVELLRSTPRVVELSAACEDAAEHLIASGRADEAVALLDEAARQHDAMGATDHLNRIDSRLRDVGVRRRRATAAGPSHGWASLSPKELEVVDLVAGGLSNPQVAERLYISRRTVETHLSHVFRKLAIANRTQLAAAAVERGVGEGVDPPQEGRI